MSATSQGITSQDAFEKAVSYFESGETDFSTIRRQLSKDGLDMYGAIQTAVLARERFKSKNAAPVSDVAATPTSSSAPIIDGRPAPLAIDIARKMIQLGSHVIFFPRGTKRCTTSGWTELATRDISVVVRSDGCNAVRKCRRCRQAGR